MSQQIEFPQICPIEGGYFRSLRVKNYRLYFAGHFLSMVGVWMQIVALSWLVWRLTGSGDWLGAVGFASRILTLILALFAGYVVDKFLRQNVILITQILSMFQAFLLAVLTIMNIITPEIIIILVLFLGAVYAFDFTARMSFLSDLVGRADVDNAVALSSSAVHAGRVIGPAIAGIIVAYWGEGACFIVNAVSFLALIVALMLIDKSELNKQPAHNLPMIESIKEGLILVYRSATLKSPLILLAGLSFFGIPYYILIPMFISEVYERGAKDYGFIMAASAAGSLAGALIMARSSGRERLKNNMKISAIGFSISVVAYALMPSFHMGLVSMFFVGFFTLISLASINSWLQKESPDHARGRVMSIYTMMFFGITPFGSLLAGILAERYGAPLTLAGGGIACTIIALWFYLSFEKKIR